MRIASAHLIWANDADAAPAAAIAKKNDAGLLHVRGSCTMAEMPNLLGEIAALNRTPTALDIGAIEALDSAGALVLLRLLDPNIPRTGAAAQRSSAALPREPQGASPAEKTAENAGDYSAALSKIQNIKPAQQLLLTLVAGHASTAPIAATAGKGFSDWVAKVGEFIEAAWIQSHALVGFFGKIFHSFWLIMAGTRKLRMTSVVHHIERTGLDAVPIICLLCFIFGAVVAYLSASAMKDFGAGILTVEIVSVSFLREFGVLLTAILVAGRSGSAFTAEIGSMKTREEIDAIKALSLDPIELLVVPRVCALVITLPMLTFLGVLSGIFGGALVGATSLDISLNMFFTRMQDNTELYYLWLGLIKAPVFAFLIAAIGCLEGLKVSGSAESVGLHTTSSVVQSIFLVIVVDALFAVLFMQLDL